MQRAMEEINADHVARGLPPFEMGIGINTGEAVVGNIGSEQRAKYAVVGSAVNVAGRVEGATVGGQIYVTASTYAAIADLAEVALPVSFDMKGLSEPLLLYELRGIGGRFAQRLGEGADGGPDVAVELPLAGVVVEGKVIGQDAIRGVVLRLGRRRLDVRLSTPLAPLTNVRFTLTYPALGRDSAGVYGKVVSGAPEALTRVRLTSVGTADDEVFAAILAGSSAAAVV